MESGSSLNKGKCHTYCWNTPPSLHNTITRCLGFAASTEWTSFKYLGLPIFLNRAYSRDWFPQVEKFKIKLQSWGINWLNMAGKTVLIKVVLSNLPLYQFSVLLAPIGILQKKDQHIRIFFGKGVNTMRGDSRWLNGRLSSNLRWREGSILRSSLCRT